MSSVPLISCWVVRGDDDIIVDAMRVGSAMNGAAWLAGRTIARRNRR